MLTQILLLTGSLVLLVFGAESLVRGASRLALRFGISPLFVGLTVVGFGTSTPELGASMTATLEGRTSIAVGNVIGSNLFNIAVILAATAIARPVSIRIRTIRRDLVFLVLAGASPLVIGLTLDNIPRWVGVILLGVLVTSVTLAWHAAKQETGEDAQRVIGQIADRDEPSRPGQPVWLAVLGVVVGLAVLAIGSGVLVNASIGLARSLGISELLIGLTIVAAGTSMPELITSLVAALRNRNELALGNIIGSNIFNVFGILGICAVVSPQTVHRQTLILDGPALLLVSVMLLPLLHTGARLSKLEGGFLLACYGVYLGLAIYMGVQEA